MIRWALIFFLIIFTVSCDELLEESLSVDCNKCYQEKPEEGPLRIKVTINDNNPYVPIVIYKNKIESLDKINDAEIFWIDTLYEEKVEIDIPVDQFYSVIAEYITDTRVIYALDGDEIKISKNTTDCDTPCWVFRGGSINVKLKYDD